jgi:hypothetical protein
MKRDDVEKIRLGEPDESVNLATGKPMSYPVIGLPDHLKAQIISGAGAYKYRLWRTGDVKPYDQQRGWGPPTPEAALQALKKLLNWDPV